jgi:hypothetical protein
MAYRPLTLAGRDEGLHSHDIGKVTLSALGTNAMYSYLISTEVKTTVPPYMALSIPSLQTEVV